MTFDPRKSAREKTPFGAFQMHRSHLATGPDPRSPAERERAEREARWAAAGCRPLDPEPTAVTAAHDRTHAQAIRHWAWANDIGCPAKGPLPRAVVEAYELAKEI